MCILCNKGNFCLVGCDRCDECVELRLYAAGRDDVGDEWIQAARWYRAAGEEVRVRSMQWWREQRGERQGVWGKCDLQRLMGGVSEEQATAFFDSSVAQGGVVYAWGRADGSGGVYVGSSIGGVFMGAQFGDRLHGHLTHVRRHRRGECRCQRKVYVAAAAAHQRCVQDWVFVPVLVLGPKATAEVTLRVERCVIRRVRPRLNTVGVQWDGRDARKVRTRRRRRPKPRPRQERRQRGADVGRGGVTAGRVPGGIVQWSSVIEGDGVGPTHNLVPLLRVVACEQLLQHRAVRWTNGGRGCVHASNLRTLCAAWVGAVFAVAVPGQCVHVGSMRAVLRCCRQATQGVVCVMVPPVVPQHPPNPWVRTLVTAFERYRFSALSQLYGCSNDGLLWVWRRLGRRPRGVCVDKAGRVIRAIMLKRCGFRVRRKYVVRMPFQRGVATKLLIKKLVQWGLVLSKLPCGWVDEIVQCLSVVYQQRPTVGVELDTHHQYAAKFDVHTPFACVCAQHPIRRVWRGARPMGPHVAVLLSECVGDVVERVSAVGSAFIPKPHAELTWSEVYKGMNDFGFALGGVGEQFTAGWGALGRRKVAEVVEMAGCGGEQRAMTGVAEVTVKDVRGVKVLCDGLVVGPVDRNTKDRFIECPYAYWLAYKRTFWTEHYVEERVGVAVQEPVSTIVGRWRRLYVQRGWTEFAPLVGEARSKIAGVSYIMPKMKDLQASSPHALQPRRRPLTPYGGRGRCGHPYRQLMRMCGAVLSAALADAGLQCWHLSAVHKFADRMDSVWTALRRVGSEQQHYTVRLFPFDVKAMFTELSKVAVLDAVTWLLEANPGWRRRRGRQQRYPTGAFVSKGARGFVARCGPGLRGGAGETRVPLSVVLEMVRFDLEESVMQCGVHVLWQVRGIPMGSFLSAILAGVTVAVAEHRFYASLPATVRRRVEGVRYADDGVVGIVEWPGSSAAAEVFEMFVDNCYPRPLELTVEEHGGRFLLLESIVTTFPDGTGWVMHQSKIWDDLVVGTRSRYRVWTGRGSWAGDQRGILLGTLLRVDANCSQGNDVRALRYLMILQVLVEAEEVGGYEWRQIRRVLQFLAVSRGMARNSLWYKLALAARVVDSARELLAWACRVAVLRIECVGRGFLY